MTAYESAHDLCIRSFAYMDAQSQPHDIPWEGDTEDYAWRAEAEIERGLVIA